MRSLPHCETCHGLDLSKLQPNPRLRVLGDTPRHWIMSSELKASVHDSSRSGSYNGHSFRGCMTCLMLSKAVETLVTQAQLVGDLQGATFDDVKYRIAFTDKPESEDMRVGDRWSKGVKSGRPGSQSLHFVLRVTPPGSDPDSFQEEFTAELYTPPGGKLPLYNR